MNRTSYVSPERRRHPRRELCMTVQAVRLDPDGGDVIDSFDTVDISRGGMGVISRRPVYPGQRVLLCLPLSGDGGRRNLYATVVRCRRDGEQGYRAGIEFDSASLGVQCGAAVAAVAAA